MTNTNEHGQHGIAEPVLPNRESTAVRWEKGGACGLFAKGTFWICAMQFCGAGATDW